MTMIKYSIITICLNMEAEIGNTITSVLRQSCTDFEYLIKDGVSRDGTVGVAESFVEAFAGKGISYRIISQSDSGIYDAMNQAVREARGEWLIFMNAGDRFANSSVLDCVDKSGCLKDADIVYGDRILHNQQQYRYQKAYPLEKMRVGLPFCHQSVFTKRTFFDNNAYSLKYKMCSDFHFYLQLYREGRKFVHLPFPVSIYDVNGVSSNWKLNYQDKIQILEDMPVRDEEAIQELKKKLSQRCRQEFIHKHLWRFIPAKYRECRRNLMRKKAGWKTEEEFFGKEKECP